VDVEALRGVGRSQHLHRIGRHCGRRWNLCEKPPIWPQEPERAVGLSIDLKAFLVDRAVVPPTEQREVRERGRAASGPVADMVPLTEPDAAAGKAAAAVPMLEGPA
jgi:hypothetical protein